MVTIDEAKHHLRIDGDDEDQWLEMWILAVEGAILSWLKDSWRAYVQAVDSDGQPVTDSNGDPVPAVDSSGEPVGLPLVKAAALLELAQHYRFRDGKDAGAMPAGAGYTLGMGATSLLNGLRRSTLA